MSNIQKYSRMDIDSEPQSSSSPPVVKVLAVAVTIFLGEFVYRYVCSICLL